MPFYGHMGHMHHFHRGPSRLFWFILGGVATAWWIKHKEIRGYDGCFGHCIRKPIRAPPTPNPTNMDDNVAQPRPAPNSQWDARYESPSRNSSPPIALPFGWSNEEWEMEKEKMWSMGRQAGDTMSELSEQTLDNVLSTVESLKAKLAKSREEREKQRQLFDQQMEERKKEPRHYV